GAWSDCAEGKERLVLVAAPVERAPRASLGVSARWDRERDAPGVLPLGGGRESDRPRYRRSIALSLPRVIARGVLPLGPGADQARFPQCNRTRPRPAISARAERHKPGPYPCDPPGSIFTATTRPPDRRNSTSTRRPARSAPNPATRSNRVERVT